MEIVFLLRGFEELTLQARRINRLQHPDKTVVKVRWQNLGQRSCFSEYTELYTVGSIRAGWENVSDGSARALPSGAPVQSPLGAFLWLAPGHVHHPAGAPAPPFQRTQKTSREDHVQLCDPTPTTRTPAHAHRALAIPSLPTAPASLFPECRWSRGCFPFSRGKPHNLLGLSRAAPQGQISVLVLLPGAWAHGPSARGLCALGCSHDTLPLEGPPGPLPGRSLRLLLPPHATGVLASSLLSLSMSMAAHGRGPG